MRASVAPTRASLAGGTAQRIAAKQAELEALINLKNESARLAHEMTVLSERVDELASGGQAIAAVMSSWRGVFRAIQIAQATAAAHREAQGEDAAAPAAPERARNVPDTLVRMPTQTGVQ
ncbi:DASH complex subunit dad2 [Malassezia cuniculi]|uniref:DASH complex subunit DAD2 n=1 Tax=Malassezia cuniculi TaxID=948313 RepID=A0AAF0ETW8_9BASI|nr:DASH complex subunit dad2 [Malassezia cuniculi]